MSKTPSDAAHFGISQEKITNATLSISNYMRHLRTCQAFFFKKIRPWHISARVQNSYYFAQKQLLFWMKTVTIYI